MKKIYLAVSVLLVLASCSKDVVSEKTNNNSTDVSKNEGLTLTVKDENGNLISQEVVDFPSQPSFVNSSFVSNGGFVNPEILEKYCNPFDVAAGKNFEFVKYPYLWGLPSENVSFLGDKNEEGTLSNFIKSDYDYLDNSMVGFSPNMKYEVIAIYTYGCSDWAKKDVNGDYVFDYFKDDFSPMNMTYYRDYLACSILDTYTNTISNDPSHRYYGSFLSVGDVYTEENLEDRGLHRGIRIKFLLGRWVQDTDGPF